MGTVACKGCGGRGKIYLEKSRKWVDHKACGGSGVNKDLWSTNCQRCRDEIIYKAHTNTPRYCKQCRDIQLEKTCDQSGCHNLIYYKVGWDKVPSYCKRCESKRNQGWSASTCSGTGMFGCGKLIWSPPGKKFTLCQDCGTRKKAEDAAKWREKGCTGYQGERCYHTIRYRVDWDKIPDLCPNCREKAKRAKAERDAKWREKPCATSSCRNVVKYHLDWENPPSFCANCKTKREKVRGKKMFGAHDVLPGSGRTPANLGCTDATASGPNKYGGQHVTVFNRNLGHHEHYSYDTDIDGNYVSGTAHATDAMAEVLRKHGHTRT